MTENVLAGAIPTEIGQLAQLKNLDLHETQLIGACTGNSFGYNGMRVYPKLKKTLLLHRQHSYGARAVHRYDAARAVQKPIDR